MLSFIEDLPQPKGKALGYAKFCACVVPIAQIAIGAVYLDECPAQPYIPIYLVVSGVFGMLLAGLSCLPCTQEPKDGTSNPLSRVCAAWNLLMSSFLLCWFIPGNVWIFSIYEPNYDQAATDADPYCNKTLYLFAFWITVLAYIFFGLVLIGGCCYCLAATLCKR